MVGKQQDSLAGSQAAVRAGDPIDLQDSVAGEEDPGASLDIPAAPPATAEAVCPRCGGSGQVAGAACPECSGSGSPARLG